MTENTLTDRAFAKRAALTCAIAAVAALVVARFDDVLGILSALWSVALPFLIGMALAYLLNIIMRQWERLFFPRTSSALLARLRRPVCLLLTVATVGVIVTGIVMMLSSELKTAISAMSSGASTAVQALSDLAASNPNMANVLPDLAKNWEDMAGKLVESAGGAGNIAGRVAKWGGNLVSVVVDALVAIVFALYVLAGKESFVQGARKLGSTALPASVFGKLEHVFAVANDSFSRFIGGQCLEACILGTLCALGMTLFGFPFAFSIGLCVGVMSLIPFIGAWVGGVVGALMIASVSVEQAVWFVVFLVVLQQIEGHLIYPNVVGSSVGMPGIWTFFAVIAGGALFGFAGVLFGVPAVSTIRQLALEWMARSDGGDEHGEEGGRDGEGGADAGERGGDGRERRCAETGDATSDVFGRAHEKEDAGRAQEGQGVGRAHECGDAGRAHECRDDGRAREEERCDGERGR